ncbi:MAG: hemolysin family protein [Bacteroidota bacterium]|nr:hemolysin family protein [Bacteroidota bacterium]MDP4234461.1 hemolysin family protein [Bacteroidota bacterium]MDP4243957.1 hemolysin family protein [Bacteroidota bacterium]MDP4288193.1 hemolysin family protein [Bacteroidota bacterium]
MIPMGGEILLVIFFLILHAFFSLAETSVLSVRRSRLHEMLEDEKTPEWKIRRARKILAFKSNPESFIATVQSGSVFFSFLAATYTAFIAYEHIWPVVQRIFGFSADFSLAIAFIVMIIGVTVLDLTFGALIPKSIALHQSEPIALAIAPTLGLILRTLKPIVHLPVVISNLVLRPLKDRTSFTESLISEEEFRVMLEEGTRSGTIDKTENELIENIFDFRDRTAREIMVPRIKMSAINLDLPREEVIDRIIQEGYTRLPVYRDTLDNVLGVIYSKDVVALIEHPELIILFDIIRPVPFVPETKNIADLLGELQREKHHLAIVVDEFGGTAGLITLEDIIEEIVGEIQDEYDEEQRTLQVAEDRLSAALSANYSIADANRELEKIFPDFHIPDDEEYESVSGYVNKLFGHIPDLGETIETQGVKIVVAAKGPMNVSKVRFEAMPDYNLRITNG